MSSPVQIIDINPEEFSQILKELDQKLLDPSGNLLLHPNAFYNELDHTKLRIWCSQRGRYTLPTVEFVEWLKEVIGDRSCIEIGAGKGDLARHLGIKATDSYMQETPHVKAYFASVKQATTNPPADVERLEARAAVRKYRPQVVIGSWITGKTELFGGTDEQYIVGQAEVYIHIGNRKTHGRKKILELPYDEYRIQVVTRASTQSENVIWVWRKNFARTS